jgi:hypothetical protein
VSRISSISLLTDQLANIYPEWRLFGLNEFWQPWRSECVGPRP